MMAQFSLPTRRILAVGIAVLAVLGLINLVIMPVYGVTARSLSALQDAKFQRARLEAVVARPPLPRSEPVPHSLYLVAPDRQRAIDMVIAAIGRTAQGYQVELDSVAPVEADPAHPEAIGITLSMRGEHDNVLALINDLEQGQPAVHFQNWTLKSDTAASAAPVVPVSEEGAPAVPSRLAAPGATPTGGLTFSGVAAAVWERPS
jgi:hypothetical protein